MVDIAANMSYKYESDQCICRNARETQEHIYNCDVYSSDPKYKETLPSYLELTLTRKYEYPEI